MNKDLYEKTKIVAYYLWECTGHENALSLWYCAEDLAHFFETREFFTVESIMLHTGGCYDIRYIAFVRNIAFRIFVYTKNSDHLKNWYDAEALLGNKEWVDAVIQVAQIFHNNKRDFSKLVGVRSEHVRSYYASMH